MAEKKICREIKNTSKRTMDALLNLNIILNREQSIVRTMVSNGVYPESQGVRYIKNLQKIYLIVQTLLVESRKVIVGMNKEKEEFRKLKKKEKKENERVKIIN